MADLKPTPARLDLLHAVEHLARRAIDRRLGYPAPDAVIAVTPDPDRQDAVILHVNSGGNALAAASALNAAGYRTGDTYYDPFQPGHYGVQVLVTDTGRAVLNAANPPQ